MSFIVEELPTEQVVCGYCSSDLEGFTGSFINEGLLAPFPGKRRYACSSYIGWNQVYLLVKNTKTRTDKAYRSFIADIANQEGVPWLKGDR